MGKSFGVTIVTSAKTNGAYKQNEVIRIKVTFSEVVNVTGTPTLTLETGSSDAVVNYTTGTGTATLSFDYTVGAGHNSLDLDYVGTSALQIIAVAGINSNATGYAATLTLPAPGAAGSLGANKALVIDNIVPTVTDVTSSTPNGTYVDGQAVTIEVIFSEVVIVTGTPTLTLETGVTGGTAVNYSGGSGTNTLEFEYTVSVGEASLDLDYKATNSLSKNGGKILDLSLIHISEPTRQY